MDHVALTLRESAASGQHTGGRAKIKMQWGFPLGSSMISEVVWLVGYRANAEHDCELQFQLRGIEDKCTQSEAGLQGFLGRIGS